MLGAVARWTQARLRRVCKRAAPARLAWADLTDLDLRGISLPGADLRRVRCIERDLTGANLDGARLGGGLFVGSSFREASLRGADLSEARLERCDLTGADVTGAEFENADLTGARVDWDAIGRGRFRVDYVEGLATGGYGELEQDYAYSVVDQKNGCEVARFEGHYSRNLILDGPADHSGVERVRVDPGGRTLTVTRASGAEERLPLPA